MWLVHMGSGEEGWHVCQEGQREPCNLLVFVKQGGLWVTKYWHSTETRIRAKNYAEEQEDERVMRQSGFFLNCTDASSVRNLERELTTMDLRSQ